MDHLKAVSLAWIRRLTIKKQLLKLKKQFLIFAVSDDQWLALY